MTPDRRQFLIAGGATVAGLVTPDVALADANTDAAAFIKVHVEKIRPLEIASNKAWWTANISGKDEDFKTKEDAQNKIDEALADKPTFAKLKALKAAKDAGQIADKLVARQVEILYLQYHEKQVDADVLKKIAAKANAVEQTFNVYRAKVDGVEVDRKSVV